MSSPGSRTAIEVSVPMAATVAVGAVFANTRLSGVKDQPRAPVGGRDDCEAAPGWRDSYCSVEPCADMSHEVCGARAAFVTGRCRLWTSAASE